MHNCKCGIIIGDEIEVCFACDSSGFCYRKRAIEAEKKLAEVEAERDNLKDWLGAWKESHAILSELSHHDCQCERRAINDKANGMIPICDCGLNEALTPPQSPSNGRTQATPTITPPDK
jgi:hypothetical protein